MDILMNRLFDIKEKLTDAEYKGFCDDIAEQYKVKDQLNGYCELKFTRTVIRRGLDGDTAIFDYYNTVQTLIVKMETTVGNSTISTIQQRIADEGLFPLCIESLKEIVGTTRKAEVIWNEYMGGYYFVDTKEHLFHIEDEEDTRISTETVLLRPATGVALISFKLL